MRRLLLFVLLLAAVAHAQSYTPITSSALQDQGGNKLVAGQISFAVPIAFQVGGGGIAYPRPASCVVVNGAVAGTCQVPDSARTNALNVPYTITATDTTTGDTWTLGTTPITCSTTPAPSPCTGGVWNLDAFVPPGGPYAVVQSLINFKGAWSSAAVYNAGDVVSYNGSSYISVVPANLNNTPGSTTQWMLAASKGEPGTTTATGTNGDFIVPGELTAAKVNGELFASGSATPVAVAAPVLSAGLYATATGGTVAAGSYKAQITFIGAGGETTASPNGVLAWDVITTSGSTSVLYVNAQEAPVGATCFNGYIQTNGSGSFYKQGSCTALGRVLKITTTPVTSGTTPPVSNTALAPLAAAQASLSGSPGKITVPTSVSTAAGVAGDPGTSQVVEDLRFGTIQRRSQGVPMKTSTYGAILGTSYVDQVIPSQLTTGQQAQAFSSVIHAEDSPFYGGGINPANPSAAVAGFFGAYRGVGRTEALWALNPLIAVSNLSGTGSAYAVEASIFNQSGSDAVDGVGGIGFHAASLGNNRAWLAHWITPGPSGWVNGIRIEDGAVQNTSVYVGAGATTGLYVKSPSLFASQGTNTAMQIVPGNDAFNYAFQGQNHANNATVWYVFNNGTALFPVMQSGAYLSTSANPAQSGSHRLASGDTVCWRNNVNTGDVCVYKNTSDQVIMPGGYTGTKTAGSCSLTIVGGIINNVTGC